MSLILRLRTKDGTERLTAPAGCTLGELRGQIEASFGVPVGQQLISRSKGPGGREKGEAYSAADDANTLSGLGMANGEMLYLDYQAERENQARYVEKDPFSTLVKEGELRKA